MKKFFLIISLLFFVAVSQLIAQMIKPMAQVTDDSGDIKEYNSYEAPAPLQVHFVPGDLCPAGAYFTYFEWRFYKDVVVEGQQYLVRHEKETDFTFNDAGTHFICLIASYVDSTGVEKEITEEDYVSKTYDPICINIHTSKLEFPNAFSSFYKAKEYQSIVEFKAAIYNRWGQKLHEWTDPAGGWNGTYHGREVKQGVYFVHVQAKGADGVKYNIKKDVNLLRGHTIASGGNN